MPVPGLDADLAAVRRIVEGTQSMTIYRRLAIQDQVAAQVAYAWATGKEIEDLVEYQITSVNNGYTDLPAILFGAGKAMFAVDTENIKEIVDDGWLDADDIYAYLDKELWPDWYN